jgi:hypothetical protein
MNRRADPYEPRRELALAAGVDPDSRIDRPGQRSIKAALEAASKARWHLIETAPKDGALKIIGRGRRVTCGYWAQGDGAPSQ